MTTLAIILMTVLYLILILGSIFWKKYRKVFGDFIPAAVLLVVFIRDNNWIFLLISLISCILPAYEWYRIWKKG